LFAQNLGNYLSPLRLDGSPNPDYRPVHQHSRPSLEKSRSVERPLCSGLLYGAVNGATIRISTCWDKACQTYIYDLSTDDPLYKASHCVWNRRAFLIDEAVVYHLMKRLEYTFSEEGWEAMTQKLKEPQTPDRTVEEAQLQIVNQQIQNTLMGLKTADEPDLILQMQEDYRKLNAEKARLNAILQPKQPRLVSREQLEDLRGHFDTLLAGGWRKMARNERRVFLQQMIERITLVEFVTRGTSRFIIRWMDGDETERLVYRKVENKQTPFSYAEHTCEK
jgi:hypothetical protein